LISATSTSSVTEKLFTSIRQPGAVIDNAIKAGAIAEQGIKCHGRKFYISTLPYAYVSGYKKQKNPTTKKTQKMFPFKEIALSL